MRHLIKKILRESDFDWVEDINPIFTEDSAIIFDKIPTKAEWGGLLKFVEDEIGNHAFGYYDYGKMLQRMRDDEGFVIYVEPKKYYVITHSDYSYYLTDEIENFVRYELSQVLEQLIKDYMKMYDLNESTNDFDWVSDVDDSHGWFERYKENLNEFTHLLNFANKYYKEFYGGEQDFFTQIGSYICEKGTLPEAENFCRNIHIKWKSYLGTMYLTSILDEDRLNRIKSPINHNEWGEGFDDDRGYKYSSWFITVDDVTLHIGIDHRGTSISVREQDIHSFDQLLNAIKKLIDLTI